MAYGNAGDVLSGAGSGAATGAVMGSIVPGLGTGIGAGVGALMGGLGSGLFGGRPNVPDTSGALQSMYKTRQNDINAFGQQLAAVRQKYLAQLPQYQNYAMGRFMPQIEANLAGRGLQVSGGAFGSALARQAGDFTQQQMLAAPQMEAQDLTTVENLRNGAFGQTFSPMAQVMQGQAGNELNRNLGQYQDVQSGIGSGILGLAMSGALNRKPQGQVVDINRPNNLSGTMGRYVQ